MAPYFVSPMVVSGTWKTVMPPRRCTDCFGEFSDRLRTEKNGVFMIVGLVD